ncbi:MAG: hypothetical protein N2645_15070 [Clostridia bacterium]|nr:hypothetical protein [Clostridia bacterium]
MDNEIYQGEKPESENKNPDVIYSSDKDFYRGIGGELRYKAEGLFKKAKEKGISIEDIHIDSLKEAQGEFPGIGVIDLPAYVVKVRGRHIPSGQIIIDAKQIDYYNIYQVYVADKIEHKNVLRDERGRAIKEYGKNKLKYDLELFLTEWERFEIGKKLVEDKEFGLEKTITGACDRVIRKLMGENDWLYPEEAKLLDEEFNNVQSKIAKEQENKKSPKEGSFKMATERQINYLKTRIKNLGLDPEDKGVVGEILRQAGFGDSIGLKDLSTTDMSKVIEVVSSIVPKVKEEVGRKSFVNALDMGKMNEPGSDIRQ